MTGRNQFQERSDINNILIVTILIWLWIINNNGGVSDRHFIVTTQLNFIKLKFLLAYTITSVWAVKYQHLTCTCSRAISLLLYENKTKLDDALHDDTNTHTMTSTLNRSQTKASHLQWFLRSYARHNYLLLFWSIGHRLYVDNIIIIPV